MLERLLAYSNQVIDAVLLPRRLSERPEGRWCGLLEQGVTEAYG